MGTDAERPQGLMLTTDTPLGQIAVYCGLVDQSHFSRLFHRPIGGALALGEEPELAIRRQQSVCIASI